MIRSQDGGRGAAALPPERPSHAPSEPPACAESLAREGTPVAAQGPSSDEEEADSSGASSLPARGQPGGAGGGPGALAGAGGHCHGRRAAGPPRAGRLLDFLPPTSRSQQDCDGWFTVPMAAVITAIAWGPGHATVPSGPGRALSQGPSPRGHRPAGGGLGRRSWMPAHSGLRPGPARPHGGRDAAGAPACSCLETPGRQLRLSS